MTINILGLHLSPRLKGNSLILLEEFFKGATQEGAECQRLSVVDLNINGCLSCGGCDETGECVQNDDMDKVYSLLEKSELVVVACPIFFYGPPAQGKALIDRSQAMWARKYYMKTPTKRSPGAQGFLLAVGASKGADLFMPTILNMKYFFDAINLPKTFEGLYFNKVDKVGDFSQHPEIFEQCFEAGRKYVYEYKRTLNMDK